MIVALELSIGNHRSTQLVGELGEAESVGELTLRGIHVGEHAEPVQTFVSSRTLEPYSLNWN